MHPHHYSGTSVAAAVLLSFILFAAVYLLFQLLTPNLMWAVSRRKIARCRYTVSDQGIGIRSLDQDFSVEAPWDRVAGALYLRNSGRPDLYVLIAWPQHRTLTRLLPIPATAFTTNLELEQFQSRIEHHSRWHSRYSPIWLWRMRAHARA